MSGQWLRLFNFKPTLLDSFKDREDAAEQLAERLLPYKNNAVVIAIPRGGVPVGYIIADKLNVPLDVILTKKIGHPANKEYAIGSVSLHGRAVNRNVPVPEEFIEEETKRIRGLLKEKYELYMGERKREPVNLKGKNAIVVDDGIATGHTMLATIEMIRENQPNRVIVAIPVGPPDSVKKMKRVADEVICLKTPESFIGVSQFYTNFEQVNDETVIRFLKMSNNRELVSKSS